MSSHRIGWSGGGKGPAGEAGGNDLAGRERYLVPSLIRTYAEMLLARGLAILGSFGVAILTARMLAPRSVGAITTS